MKIRVLLLGLWVVSLALIQAKATIPAIDQSGIAVRADYNPHRWQADFDDDGRPDTLQAVEVTPNFQPSAKVGLLNFWDQTALRPPQKLALQIVNSRSQRTFLVYGQSYFGSPIWQQQLPIQVIRRGSPAHQAWAKQAKLTGDGIVLATEAGIDTLLYWDGTAYLLYAPPEIP